MRLLLIMQLQHEDLPSCRFAFASPHCCDEEKSEWQSFDLMFESQDVPWRSRVLSIEQCAN